MNVYNEEVGARLRQFRKAKGMTQDELGGCVGVTRSHICYLESGKFNFKADLLTELAIALRIDREMLTAEIPIETVEKGWEEMFEDEYNRGYANGLAAAMKAIRKVKGYADGH